MIVGQTERVLWGTAGVLALGLVWHVWPGNAVVPSLGAVTQGVISATRDGELVRDAVASLFRVLFGVSIALMLSTALALAATVFRPTRYLLAGLELIRPIPPLAWTPLAIMVFGIGDSPAVAIVALGAFFPIWLGFLQGLDAVQDEHVQAARSLGASKRQVIAFVVLPSITPFVLHGLRLGGGLGWFCVVAAEMMGASSGLGYGVQLRSLNIQMEAVFAYLLAIAALGGLVNVLLRYLEELLCSASGVAR